MIYEMTPRGQASKKSAQAAAKAFEDTMKAKGRIEDQGVKTVKWSLAKTEISFFGQTFSFSPIWAFVGGFFISALASFLGIGGGFLYVPFLTSIVGLPMFVVAGTSALSVLIGRTGQLDGVFKLQGKPFLRNANVLTVETKAPSTVQWKCCQEIFGTQRTSCKK